MADGLHGKRIYLASPLGFSEAGTQFIRQFLGPELERLGAQVINPFDLINKERIEEIAKMPVSPARIEAWRAECRDRQTQPEQYRQLRDRLRGSRRTGRRQRYRIGNWLRLCEAEIDRRLSGRFSTLGRQ